MLIAELLENDAIEPEMILRNISRKMRSGKLVFPAVFAYLTQESPGIIPIVFPVRGLEQQYNLPFEFADDLMIYAMIMVGDKISVEYSIRCRIKNIKAATHEEIKNHLYTFLRDYFYKIFGPLGGVPLFGSFHSTDHGFRFNIEWQRDPIHKFLTKWLNDHNKLICHLADKRLINDFATLVKTIQHVE